MMGVVRTATVQFQIAVAVICSISVYMVDYFRGEKFSAKASFHNFSVNIDDPSIFVVRRIAIQQKSRVALPSASLVSSEPEHFIGYALRPCQAHSLKSLHDGPPISVESAGDFQGTYSTGIKSPNGVPVDRAIVFGFQRIAIETPSAVMLLAQIATVGGFGAVINSTLLHGIHP